MRLASFVTATILTAAATAFGTATVSVRESGTGNASINTTAGSTVTVEVRVTADQAVSGIQYDLSAGTSSVLTVAGPADAGGISASINDAGWDNNVSGGMGLPMVAAGLNTSAGPYGAGADALFTPSSSLVQTLQITVAPATPDGAYTLNASGIACPDFTSSVPPDIQLAQSTALTINVGVTCARTIAGHAIYYNNSAYDGNTAGAVTAAQENGAIAPDKSVLLPGGTATVANVIGYSRGVNGLMIDIASTGCTPLTGATVASALSFMSGNSSVIGGFAAEAIAPSVTMFAGAGASGSDRFVIILPDQPGTSPPLNTKWLRVKLDHLLITGLAADDVFYVGWAKGEANSVGGGFALVNATDVNACKLNPHTSLNPTIITDATDNNKDTLVNATDVNNALLNQTTSLNGLILITAP